MPSLKYKILKQLNPELPSYDNQCKLDLLFHGGSNVLENASMFIPQLLTEKPKTYKNKLQTPTHFYPPIFQSTLNII